MRNLAFPCFCFVFFTGACGQLKEAPSQEVENEWVQQSNKWWQAATRWSIVGRSAVSEIKDGHRTTAQNKAAQELTNLGQTAKGYAEGWQEGPHVGASDQWWECENNMVQLGRVSYLSHDQDEKASWAVAAARAASKAATKTAQESESYSNERLQHIWLGAANAWTEAADAIKDEYSVEEEPEEEEQPKEEELPAPQMPEGAGPQLGGRAGLQLPDGAGARLGGRSGRAAGRLGGRLPVARLGGRIGGGRIGVRASKQELCAISIPGVALLVVAFIVGSRAVIWLSLEFEYEEPLLA